MGQADPNFENNLIVRVCPCCGEVRPIDWFGPEGREPVYENAEKSVKIIDYVVHRKYFACWKCRMNKINTDWSIPRRADHGKR